MAFIQKVDLSMPPVQRIPKSFVVNVDNEQKQAMLGPFAKWVQGQEASARALLGRLQSLSPSTATCIKLKPPVDTDMPFRLIKHPLGSNSFQSFIALSYRWPQHDGTSDEPWQAPDTDVDYRLPISPLMFRALFAEIAGSEEGLWCDQVCINQRDGAEMEKSIGNMDTIYRAARNTIVVLGDVTLSAQEAQFLTGNFLSSSQGPNGRLSEHEGLRASTAYVTRNPELAYCVEKIVSSSWFERVWCSHEMRLARQHAFLVKYESPDEIGGFGVLRIKFEMLQHMLSIVGRSGILELLQENIFSRPFAMSFVSKVDGISNILALTEMGRKFPEAPFPKWVVPWRERHRRMLLRYVNEILALNAGGNPMFADNPRRQRVDAFTDVVSVAFNVSENAISCRRSELAERLMKAVEKVAEGEVDAALRAACVDFFLKFALATLDPLALCTGGPQLHTSQGELSWMSRPAPNDAGSGIVLEYPAMPPHSIEAIDDRDGSIKLPFWSLDAVSERLEPDLGATSKYHKIADRFLTECLDKGVGESQDKVIHQALSESFREGPDAQEWDVRIELYKQILAHLLFCGSAWLDGLVWQRFSGHSDLMLVFVALTALLDSTAVDQVVAHQDLLSDDEQFKSAYSLLSVLNQIADLALSLYSEPGIWRPNPLLFQFSSGHLIFVIAPGQEDGLASVNLMVPLGLTDPEYRDLLRVWVLTSDETSDSDSGPRNRRLLNKTRIFGNMPFMQAKDIPENKRLLLTVT